MSIELILTILGIGIGLAGLFVVGKKHTQKQVTKNNSVAIQSGKNTNINIHSK